MVCSGKGSRDVESKSAGALKGVVVAVLGLAELVEEEDDGLQAQDQHYSSDEARSIERVLVRLGSGREWRGARVGRSCNLRQTS